VARSFSVSDFQTGLIVTFLLCRARTEKAPDDQLTYRSTPLTFPQCYARLWRLKNVIISVT